VKFLAGSLPTSMKTLLLFLTLLFVSGSPNRRDMIAISKTKLQDKIKGGWAGQFLGTFTWSDYVVASNDSVLHYEMPPVDQTNLLSQQLFFDLMYLSVLEEGGGKKSQSLLLQKFKSNAYYSGHAARVAKFNLNNGLSMPASGRWTNNPHADDPDFSMASDVLGLIAPGMPNTVAKLADPIGHIANSGEGYYGGVYLGSLTALAFLHQRPAKIIQQAIRMLPPKSEFSECLQDVVRQQKKHSDNPKLGWAVISKEWKKDSGCPASRSAIQDDARAYAAFVTMALLYGDGDLFKTQAVAKAFPEAAITLPTLWGVLGVINGYQSFPEQLKIYYESRCEELADTSLMTWTEATEVTFKLALQQIKANGGRVKSNNELLIQVAAPASIRPEKSFEGHFIAGVQKTNQPVIGDFDFEFEGVGFVLRCNHINKQIADGLKVELYLNYKYIDRIVIPETSDDDLDLCWRFQLPHNKYKARLKIIKPDTVPVFTVREVVSYNVAAPVSDHR
jgi:hypothetical protein